MILYMISDMISCPALHCAPQPPSAAPAAAAALLCCFLVSVVYVRGTDERHRRKNIFTGVEPRTYTTSLPCLGPALADTLAPDPLRLCNRGHPGAAPTVAPHPDVHLVEPAAVAQVPLRVCRGASKTLVALEAVWNGGVTAAAPETLNERGAPALFSSVAPPMTATATTTTTAVAAVAPSCAGLPRQQS